MKVMPRHDALVSTPRRAMKIAPLNINNVIKRFEGSGMRQLTQLAGRLDELARAQ